MSRLINTNDATECLWKILNKINKKMFQKRPVLYHAALRPPSRVAQSAGIGQHNTSVAIGRTLCACVGKSHPWEVVNIWVAWRCDFCSFWHPLTSDAHYYRRKVLAQTSRFRHLFRGVLGICCTNTPGSDLDFSRLAGKTCMHISSNSPNQREK